MFDVLFCDTIDEVAAFSASRSRLGHERKASEREQRERQIDYVRYCFHVFVSLHLVFCGFSAQTLRKFSEQLVHRLIVRASHSLTGYPAESGSGGALLGRGLNNLARRDVGAPPRFASIPNLWRGTAHRALRLPGLDSEPFALHTAMTK
jgi:hypothetical protein